MKLIREQFDEIGPWYMDSFAIDDGDQDLMFRVFNELPDYLKGLAVQWDTSDSVFRDDVFEFMCAAQLDMTPEEYYNSEIFKEYSEKNITIGINWEKF